MLVRAFFPPREFHFFKNIINPLSLVGGFQKHKVKIIFKNKIYAKNYKNSSKKKQVKTTISSRINKK